jgi:hypothetical protein
VTRVLIWKEVREQRAAWLTLVLTAAGVEAVLGRLVSDYYRAELLIGALWVVAWAYGLVCGSMLLAGETEEGTQPFLDAQAVTRRRLWLVKVSAGLLLLAAQMATLVGIGYLSPGGAFLAQRAALGLLGLLFFGVVGYAWGLFCGAFAMSVLGAVVTGTLLQGLSALALYLSLVPEKISLFSVGLTASGAVAWSWWIYCRTDRLRVPAVGPRLDAANHHGRDVLICLAWRRVRRPSLAMALVGMSAMAAAATFGATEGAAEMSAAALMSGVVGFVDEVRSDRGFPLGRLWFVRAGVRFAGGVGFAALAAASVAVGIALRAASTRGRRGRRSGPGPRAVCGSSLCTRSCCP